MKSRKPLFLALALGAFLTAGTVPSSAQDHANHSGYMHALTHLRLMRAYLNRWDDGKKVDPDSENAIRQIEAAMHEIVGAGIDDHKGINDHEAVNYKAPLAERIHKALDLGHQAKEDVGSEGEWGHAPGLKQRILERIDNADHLVENVLQHSGH